MLPSCEVSVGIVSISLSSQMTRCLPRNVTEERPRRGCPGPAAGQRGLTQTCKRCVTMFGEYITPRLLQHSLCRLERCYYGKVAHPHIFICRAGIQNGSREPGRSWAFLNGQFRLRKAKNCKKSNNFPLCCQLRLRTATELV